MRPLFLAVILLAACFLMPVSASAFQPASGAKSPAVPTSEESEAFRRQARAAIDSGDVATAWKLIERTRGITSPTERTAWWLLESETEFVHKNFTKSALAAMKIVILHPKSEQVGPALYWSAKAYEAIGRQVKATQLYDECIALKRTPSNIRDMATKRLAALKKAAKS